MENSRCRLCLDGLQENKFVTLEEFETNTLKTLLPEVDLGISTEPKICDKCVKLLKVCYDLKTIWLENNKKVGNVSTPNEMGPVLLCCLCGEQLLRELGSEDLTEWKEMAEKCIPELDITSSKNMTSCRKCVDDLTNVYMFLDKVVAVEANIKTYFSVGIKQEAVNLSDVFTFFYSSDKDGASEHKDFKPKEELKTEIGINPILDVKPIEKSEIPTGVFSQTPESQNGHASIETVWFPQKEDPDVNDFKGGNIRTILQTQNLVPFEGSIGSNEHQEPAVNEDEDLPVAVPWLMDEDETSNMSNQDGNLRTILQTQNLEPFKDSIGSNERQEPVVNEDEDLPVAVPWFLMDEDETFNMSNQENSNTNKPDTGRRKKSRHKKANKQKTTGKKQQGREDSPKLFYCDQCSYSAKWKSSLVSHLMRHKSPSETPMFRCKECGHETKRRADLRFHMIVHKDPAEVKQFKCPQCPYTSKRNGDLKQHLMVHETKMYKCELCTYQTPNKAYLIKRHSLVHKDKSEVPTYKCLQCQYTAKCRKLLGVHVKNMHTSQRILYKCNWCEFQCKNKVNLKMHMIMHQDSDQLQFFECHTCGFKSKRKRGLSDHIRTHQPVRSEWFRCQICSFKTYTRRYLQRHMIIHKDPSEVETFKCGICSYKSIKKGNLNAHLRRHLKKVVQEGGGGSSKNVHIDFRAVNVPSQSIVKEEVVSDGN